MKRFLFLLLGLLLVMPPNLAADATSKAAETSLEQETNLTEPLFPANEGNLWGYIRSDGSWAITPRYIDANDFNQYGIAAVVSPPNEKPLLIDKNANVIYDFSVLSSSGGYFRYGYPATIQHFRTNEEQDMFYNTATRTLITLPEDFFGLAHLGPRFISMKTWENSLVLSFYPSALNLPDNS